MSDDDVDVLVIGAGLAGLRCAGVLAAAGRDVRGWEAADDVGGRVRTDVVDGFRCDRGFQVLNPAYPELSRAVDVDALHHKNPVSPYDGRTLHGVVRATYLASTQLDGTPAGRLVAHQPA